MRTRILFLKFIRMRTKFILILFSANFYFVSGQDILDKNILYLTEDRGSNTLSIEVTKLKNNEGFVMVGLFDENNNKILAVKNIPIFERKCIFKIDSIKSGKYVVRFWHDKNNNGELDMNFLGIPKEDFGNSNNVRPKFGPPKFEDMIFKIEDNFYLKMIAQSLNLQL